VIEASIRIKLVCSSILKVSHASDMRGVVEFEVAHDKSGDFFQKMKLDW